MFLPILHEVAAHRDLSALQAHDAMLAILGGEVSTAQIAAFLVALRMKGETVEELTGFASAMRERSLPVDAGAPLLDTCGTGGDHTGTFNVSTIAAFVIAGAGVRVAKHGNRSFSSQCGSADVLEALGIRVGGDAAQIARSIRTAGIGFLFAPALQPAMKHAQPARLELKMRTVFNLLGPLTNPASATHQLIGAPSAQAAELMAGALAALGVQRAFVVHGAGGLDEVSTIGETVVFEVDGDVGRHTWNPSDFGVPAATIDKLRGGDREANAQIARDILAGARGPGRDLVLVNAAAGLLAASAVSSLREGMERAAASIDSGAAWRKVGELARQTSE